MEIAAVVGVRDEVTLIKKCVSHLKQLGVAGIVVVDNGSTDGTREILRDLAAGDPDIALVLNSGDPTKDVRYFEEGIRVAKQSFAPDWILIQDADEFLVVPDGNLDGIAERASAESVLIKRFNACLTGDLLRVLKEDRPRFELLDIHSSEARLSRASMDAVPSIAWIAGMPVEKMLARADVLSNVLAGGHRGEDFRGRELSTESTSNAVFVHVPFSTLERFERKIANIEYVLETNPNLFSGADGWHWKRWLEIKQAGLLRYEFERQFLADDYRQDARESGNIENSVQWINRQKS